MQIVELGQRVFGARIAQVEGGRLNDATINRVLQWSRDQRIACLYLLCASDDDESVRVAEQNKFHLVDLRVELSWRVQKIDNDSAGAARLFQQSDLPELQRIAADSTNYPDSISTAGLIERNAPRFTANGSQKAVTVTPMRSSSRGIGI